MIDEPLFFEPYLKSVIWGGQKIARYKGIASDKSDIGESWEISAVPGHESVVSTGFFKGFTLNELVERFGEKLLGKKSVSRYGFNFPLLIKFIDAADNLSVQVHPDDRLAAKRHNSLGKTEMWYIIDAESDAKIYAGLREQLTPEDYVKRVAEGTFAQTLAVHQSEPGDVFFLPAGRVHAIGAGNLLAEIQESSDVTYRIYDYDRRDAQGNPRELHTELAKDAIDYTVYSDYKSPRPAPSEEDVAIVACDHFTTHLIRMNGEFSIAGPRDSFVVLICTEGSVEMAYPGGNAALRCGQTVLLPASTGNVTLNGKAVLLETYV